MPTLYKYSAYSYKPEIDELKTDFEIISFEEVYGRGRYIWDEPKTMKVVLKTQSMLNNINLAFLASKQGNTVSILPTPCINLSPTYRTLLDENARFK